MTVREQYRTAVNLEARIALHERFSTNPYDMQRWLFDQMDLPPQARLLEVGCGPGTLWFKNRDRLPRDWTVVLTDASPGMVREAERRLASSKSAFSFQVADAQSLPFDDGDFDGVIAHFMLYHVPDRRRALAEIARVLRAEGTLYAATNGARHMREADALAGQAGLLDQSALDAGDAVEFGLENGQAQLTPWFSDVEMRRYDDSLVVTDAEPLLTYIFSRWDVQAALDRLGPVEGERRVQALRSLLEDEIAEDRQIRVSKDSGVFIALRPERE